MIEACREGRGTWGLSIGKKVEVVGLTCKKWDGNSSWDNSWVILGTKESVEFEIPPVEVEI